MFADGIPPFGVKYKRLKIESIQVGWFEIPAMNINRAKMFNEAVFKIEIQIMDFGQFKMAMFPVSKVTRRVPGALVYHPTA